MGLTVLILFLVKLLLVIPSSNSNNQSLRRVVRERHEESQSQLQEFSANDPCHLDHDYSGILGIQYCLMAALWMEFTDSPWNILLWLHHQLPFASAYVVAKCRRLCCTYFFPARVQVEMARITHSSWCFGY